ncbi:site-specific DNA-methyltransferase [Brachyspira sp. G79]|uniref:DNA methyltransferase n=1 Tax=Brachyspira sp. G79 TaxID=1358104 RepID=UPI000BBBC0E1
MNSEIINGDCIRELAYFKDNYFDLTIADPPYWKVINEKWDYKWKTENDYIEWSKIWIKEVYRTLRYGGSFYIFGYFRTLSLLIQYLQEIGFSIRQQIIINKGIKSIAGRATKNYKMYPNVTESILFLIKNNIPYSKSILKNRQKILGLTSKEINEAIGVKSNGGGMWSIYTGNNVCEQFPTYEIWDKLQKILKFDIPYNKIAQTFNVEMGITDVWDDIDFYSEERYHPTQKPLKLIERIIRSSSNINDNVLDPFAGSGTTLIACNNTNRNSISIEIESKYINNIKKRLMNSNIQKNYFKPYVVFLLLFFIFLSVSLKDNKALIFSSIKDRFFISILLDFNIFFSLVFNNSIGIFSDSILVLSISGFT